MAAARGYYSLIQYCPDAGRAEAVNLGVLVFCPDLGFLEARIAASNQRVARVFGRGSFDGARLNAAKAAIRARLTTDRQSFRTPDDLRTFIESRGNNVVLTPQRSMTLVDPATELDALFEEFVGGKPKKPDERAAFPQLDRALRAPSLAGRISFDRMVEVPVLGSRIKIDYAYQNGTVNLVRTQVFPGQPGNAVSAATRLAVEGDLLQRHPAGDRRPRQLVVVSRFPRALDGTIPRIRNLLTDYNIRHVEEQSVEEFADEIAREAHEAPSIQL